MLIRTRITVASLAATIIAVVTLGVAGYSSQRAADARFIEASLSSKQVLLEQLVARHTSEMRAHIKAVTRDSVALKALRGGDLATLQDQVDTTHNMFSADGTIDRLQILDPDGRYLATAPRGQSGTTRKSIVTDAAKDGVILSGLVRDDDDALQASLAFPLYARGKLKGVAVYSRSAQRIADDFQRNDGSDVFLLDSEGQQRYAAAENSAHMLSAVPDALDIGTVEISRLDGRYLAVSSVPIRLEDGQLLGALVTVQDQTATFGIQVTAKYLSWSIVVTIIALSAFGVFWYIRRSFQPINSAVESMTAIAAGQLN